MQPCSRMALLLVSCILCLTAAALADSSPPIQVQLRSPWPSPPLVLEILEATHEEDPAAFYTLLTHLTSPWAFTGVIKGEALDSKQAGSALKKASDQVVHEAAHRILRERQLLERRGQKDNLELSLALRSQTPKIEAFWQLYRTSGLHDRWEKKSSGRECGSWIDFAGEVICSEKEMIDMFNNYDGKQHQVEPAVTSFDHIFAGSAASQFNSAPTAILYADVFSSNFWSLHKRLSEYVLGSRTGEHSLRYILRWKPLSESNFGYLAGYGAYLDLKKVDYLVIDDRKLTDTAAVQAETEGEDRLIEAEASQRLLEDQAWLSKLLKTTEEDEKQSIGNLDSAELADLAIRASYLIAKSDDPLRALRQLSQDFPRHGVALARSAPNPSKSFKSEMEHHHTRSMQSGGNNVFLNGKVIPSKDFQPFGLLPVLRSEREIINALTSINLSTNDAISLLISPVIGRAFASQESNSPFFDASDRIERNMSAKELQKKETAVITYWNDIEKEDDPRYSHWSDELRSVLRPMYPGSFPVIRRNMFNLILVMDLERLETCKFLSETVAMATSRVAVRWGFVPSGMRDINSNSARLARLYWLIFDQIGPEATAKYLRRVASTVSDPSEVKVSLSAAEKEAEKMLKMSSVEIEGLLGQYKERGSLARHYVQRLRADEAESGHTFVNGQHMPFGPHIFQFLHQAIAAQVQMIGPPIYYGEIQEGDDVSTYFYDLPDVYTSRSELIFPGEETSVKSRAIDISKGVLVETHFIYPSNDTDTVNSTLWIAGDLDTNEGFKLLKDVSAIVQTCNARLGLLHYPEMDAMKQRKLLLSKFLYDIISDPAETSMAQLTRVLDAYDDAAFTETTSYQVTMDTAEMNPVQASRWIAPDAEAAAQYWQDSNKEMKKRLNLQPGTCALIINGKVVSGFSPADLLSSDYQGLIQKEAKKVDAVVQVMSNVTTVDPDLITRACSVIEKAFFVDASLEGIFDAAAPTRDATIDRLIFKETAFTIGDKDTATLRFTVILDPITETAQVWSSTLQMLSQMEDVYIKLVLNPTSTLSELPIKRYYRYSAPARLTFDEAGQMKKEALSFREMPLDAVLTMGLDAPPSWLTMAADAIYDLDNIRLKDVVTPSVTAIYDLKYILIEGHVRDEVTKVTPRGLQVILETLDGAEQLDTIVMANLAYFQFRAKPGLYRLKLRQGRSMELFDMISVGNAGLDSPRVEITGDTVALSTLQGLTVYPRVAKKKGKEREILVEEEGQSATVMNSVASVAEQGVGGLFSKAKGLFKSVKEGVKSTAIASIESEHAEINVFTVASGHLYERMTYIMILSTIKHTNHTVKFWFIENFLSPSFKDFIPHLAKEYGFQYELITYAWPHWLRSQKEKQREIWGMKVLFLDVIFPLSLSKVIFVDADQIVRADLKELIDVDLHGAPYGFPPMGNDSFDMDNFRFWEQPGGYWQKFLNGKPYPISALFVVDLNRFRLQAAGDKLRGNYQALTQDPNSLSNLDQDLVASMIHVVNIHSLQKEWLWCETWCSWDWYDQAKSIDLCSNPKTKEPKLDRAKRQIPEWTVLDDEIAEVAKKFKEQGKIGANVVAPVESTSQHASDSPPNTSNQHDPIRHTEL